MNAGTFARQIVALRVAIDNALDAWKDFRNAPTAANHAVLFARMEELNNADRELHRPERRNVHRCSCCGEVTANGVDCCTDEFAEPGEIRETGR